MSYDGDIDSRDGSTRNTRIPEVELGPTARRRIGRRGQILYYMSVVGKMFGTTIEQSHYVYDIPRCFPGENSESFGSFVESLFQVELCARALIAEKLEMAKAFSDLAMSEG